MQDTLWEVIDGELHVSHAPPEPEWEHHTRVVLSHCFARRTDHCRARVGTGPGQGEEKIHEAIEKVVIFCNGDIRGDRFVHHHTARCHCRTDLDAKNGVFGALMEVGMLLSSEDLPTENRWGSSTQSLAKVVGSIMLDLTSN